jgi:virginiamycin B lyase
MQRRHFASIAFALVLLVSSAPAARAFLVEVHDLPEGAQPYSVAAQTFGRVWYSAQGLGALGIVDPAMGEIEHIELGENSQPKAVLEGPDGNPWLVDSGLNAIVRVQPTLQEVETWPLPEDRPDAGLTGAVFDGDGVLWFTGQTGIYGRFDPQTGDMAVFDTPGGHGAYGITVTPDGDIYYASPDGHHITRVDRASGEAEVIEPPTPDQGARGVAVDSEGRIWVSEENAGQISRYDPETGEWAAWPLPSEEAQPYAIYVDTNDVVWVTDFGTNEVHAFDSSREEFAASYPASLADAQVRQIVGGMNEIWLPESGLDRLMLIRPGTIGLY